MAQLPDKNGFKISSDDDDSIPVEPEFDPLVDSSLITSFNVSAWYIVEIPKIVKLFRGYFKWATRLSLAMVIFTMTIVVLTGFGVMDVDPTPLSVLIGSSGASFTVHIFGVIKDIIRKA